MGVSGTSQGCCSYKRERSRASRRGVAMGTDLRAPTGEHLRLRVTSGLRQCSPPKVPPTLQSPGRRIRSSGGHCRPRTPHTLLNTPVGRGEKGEAAVWSAWLGIASHKPRLAGSLTAPSVSPAPPERRAGQVRPGGRRETPSGSRASPPCHPSRGPQPRFRSHLHEGRQHGERHRQDVTGWRKGCHRRTGTPSPGTASSKRPPIPVTATWQTDCGRSQ